MAESTLYCRHIRIRLIKETADITRNEIEYIEKRIKNLDNTQNDQEIWSIKHQLLPPMNDGKVYNAITDTSLRIKYYIGSRKTDDSN